MIKNKALKFILCSIFLCLSILFIITSAFDITSKSKDLQSKKLLDVGSYNISLYEYMIVNSESSESKSKLNTNYLQSDNDNIGSDYSNVSIYDIKDGDTLSSISKMSGFSVDKLANYNDIRDVNLIYSDSSLQIPDDN